MIDSATLQGARTTLLLAATLGLLAGCGQKAAPAAAAGGDGSAPIRDYHPAPELLGGAAGPGGRFRLEGSARPGAAVRLSSPGGAQQLVTADAAGTWRFDLGPSPAPRLLSLSTLDDGRWLQAAEYLFLTPDGVVARLRSGGGTQAPVHGEAALAALAIDYDNQRAATLSGLAGPRETVTVRIDGVEKGQAVADSKGRFVLPLEPLAAGDHMFELLGARQQLHFSAAIDAPAQLGSQIYLAARDGQGWRVDWVTPGGGEQTTLILGPSEPGA